MTPKRQFVPAQTKNRRMRLFVILALIAVIFLVPPLRNGLRRGVSFIGTGIAHAARGTGGFLGSIGTGFRAKNKLAAENADLRAEVARLSSKVASEDVLARENAELKAVMGRVDSSSFILAVVLGKPPHSVYDTLLIDGGARAGFVVGQMVYANGETPIGTIAEVMPLSAVVRLYSAPGEKTEARLSPSNTDVTLTGRGGGNFSTTVPHELVVETGASVVSKELDPKVIGTFMKVTSDARDPFQTLLIASPVNVNDLSFVQVRRY